MLRIQPALICLLLFATGSLSACSRGPLKVSGIQMGRALNSDKSIATHTTRFAPDQTVYVAVLTDGPGTGEVTARWSFGGRVVSQETRSISYTSSAATEFHISYAGGFPPGAYRVEILVDGAPLETREFRVAP